MLFLRVVWPDPILMQITAGTSTVAAFIALIGIFGFDRRRKRR
jgi:hypothetical protein